MSSSMIEDPSTPLMFFLRMFMQMVKAITENVSTIVKAYMSFITSRSSLMRALVVWNSLRLEIILNHTKKLRSANMYPGIRVDVLLGSGRIP